VITCTVVLAGCGAVLCCGAATRRSLACTPSSESASRQARPSGVSSDAGIRVMGSSVGRHAVNGHTGRGGHRLRHDGRAALRVKVGNRKPCNSHYNGVTVEGSLTRNSPAARLWCVYTN